MVAVPSAFTVWLCGWITWNPDRWERFYFVPFKQCFQLLFCNRNWMRIANSDSTRACISYFSLDCTAKTKFSSDKLLGVLLIISGSRLLKWENIPWPGWVVKLVAKTVMKMNSLLAAIFFRLCSSNCVWLLRTSQLLQGGDFCETGCTNRSRGWLLRLKPQMFSQKPRILLLS